MMRFLHHFVWILLAVMVSATLQYTLVVNGRMLVVAGDGGLSHIQVKTFSQLFAHISDTLIILLGLVLAARLALGSPFRYMSKPEARSPDIDHISKR